MANLKPEKVWRVGDKVFTDYVDAVKETTAHRQFELRKLIAETIAGEFVNGDDFSSVAPFAESAVVELLNLFTITRKRVK